MQLGGPAPGHAFARKTTHRVRQIGSKEGAVCLLPPTEGGHLQILGAHGGVLFLDGASDHIV